jgi:iron-sulfur cluster repair protein YtfE (RIC family)
VDVAVEARREPGQTTASGRRVPGAKEAAQIVERVVEPAVLDVEPMREPSDGHGDRRCKARAGGDRRCRGIRDAAPRSMLDPPSVELAALSTEELTSYIVRRHHRILRLSLPPVQRLSREVARERPQIQRLVGCVDTLAGALMSHMFVEEQFVFPAMIARAEHVRDELSSTEEEHAFVAGLLDEVRGLAQTEAVADLSPALAARLERLDVAARRHLALERDVLAPRFSRSSER